MKKLRILLADDHAIVRAGLKALIDGQPDLMVVGEASDGLEVMNLVGDCQPDIVVMDLSMPRMSGMEATEQLREHSPQINVLILSVHEDVTYLRRVFDAGATGYVLKHAATELLIAAIRGVAAGQIYLDPSLGATMMLHTMVGGTGRVGADIAILSERELGVLRLIAQGYSNKEIAAQLDLSVKTIETYKARAMEKLGISSRVEIVRYATIHGWLSQL
ncbi:MAG: response regulator transcription factor [Oscillochloris sp.]|nr:response regulator transcription factor [Oscillochloris sp.]